MGFWWWLHTFERTYNSYRHCNRSRNNANNKVIFKNCAPFTEYISKISNALADNAKEIDVVMPMFNLIECSEIYFKISVSLW